MISRLATYGLMLAISVFPLTVACDRADPNALAVPAVNGTRMTIQYSMRLSNGDEVVPSDARARLTFEFGADEIFPALESVLATLAPGDERSVELTAEEAYGPRNEHAVREIDLEMVPPDARSEGAALEAEDDEGNTREVTVLEIHDDKAVLDMNHPLAGESLTLAVRVLKVEPPSEPE
jgi:FKBP-type peptidyl-prolyl cis-trans isomerase 2